VTSGATEYDGSKAPNPESQVADGSPRRLSLGDPLDDRAGEDRPESWGEQGESESDRLAHYRTETPPHHGG
jgi:hypothetical protein